ncbi:MAG: patatin-like phospholipase family protein [Mycobacterium pseudokansasii]|uniref:Putative NTE family protein n=1 Tax=Mycobacterium pseudokansasii TaxID=2341080 RepID=A0A498QST6_9MYCO|nr:patatin-like phospholipase family protein [Mycobacterium pseudokansasii]KZS70770.1 alpha/beta hydrolase [Mycobacterium kansasii]MBY0391555.1 patatin-like phospholipase family protein [Mycobacterium pseudokansasii]VAZ93834.1 putative NTE family protein [Mycobacterium pseudokansasii]VAZ94827.1 putative NTE family protein [Mycobacterium pseudokansasii]VBA50034.1 putative NTE family protein [Mycobacterium pseudokansasii]
MTTAFVFSGGASLGAIQVGMLQALADDGIRPDLIIGTSVGALNGAWIAARPDAAGVRALADVWLSLTRKAVFPTHPVAGLLGFLGRRQHLVPSAGLRRILTRELGFARLEDAPIPFHVVATDVISGIDVLLSSGDAIDAIAASAAIPGIFPPVNINGRDLMDGGVVNNTPVSHAITLGADQVWVLPTGYSCALPAAPPSAMTMVLHAVSLAVNHRLALDVERFEQTADLRVIRPLCPVSISGADFSQAATLIERSHAATRQWLAQRPISTGQAALLQPHVH